MAKIRKLLFVDTKVLLDFYRTKTEASLSLLKHLDQIAPHLFFDDQDLHLKKISQAYSAGKLQYRWGTVLSGRKGE